MHPGAAANPNLFLHVAIELQPRGDLDGLAAAMSDPTNPAHRQVLSQDAFVTRFGRLPEARALTELLKKNGVSDIATAGDGLVVGGLIRISLAERLFNQPPQSRIANTTIMVIAVSLTVGQSYWCHWWLQTSRRLIVGAMR